MSCKEITDKTLGEIRSFLDELSNGTSRYQSLHSLTDQVEHQYHGRFLIELIQNAHDALFEASDTDDPQRIEIALAEDEHPYGALYIANDGRPFTSSNFKALSNLGQSDKDPQQSIGNKGIGFRSVLEITEAPEIYSRKESGSSSFDGYCFSFQPSVVQTFEEPIQRIVDGENSVKSPEIIGGQLLKWDDARYEHFRNRCRTFEEDWLCKELAFLSPYALPIPIKPQKWKKVKEYEKKGFSTVVRLPFLNDQVREVASRKLEEISESTAIFLHRVDAFRVTGKNIDKLYNRKQTPRNNDHEEGFEIRIAAGDPGDEDRRYWLWKKTIGGEENPDKKEEIQSAVEGLPGKWPEVSKATVEIAVRLSHTPDYGMLNIYLPTDLSSGCSAHFSAPFFGDMSRTQIDFENPLNSLLLETLAEKGADIILNSLSGRGEVEAVAIIDILAPIDSDDGERWWSALEEAFSSRDIEIENQDIVLSDKGWDSFSNTFPLPASEENKIIDADLLRSEATYPVFVQALQEREKGIRRVFKKIGIDSIASQEDRAETLEAIAKKLHESPESVDWNGFWHDVGHLFGRNTEPLIGKKILLGTDNQLHASDGQCSIFFSPRTSGSDEEILIEDRIDEIPEKLKPCVAFLHEDIIAPLLHEYLHPRLVERYRIDRIFRSVLIKATPDLPHNINGPRSQLCQDILHFGLKLLERSKRSMDESIRMLSRLPAPCIDGWYPIGETSFGPGWLEKSGTELEAYLRRADTPECKSALKSLLLPPDDPLWGGIGESSVDILEKAGVFDGIRLIRVTDKDWDRKFTLARWKGVKLPRNAPPCCGADIWDAYREYVKNTESPYFDGEFHYEVKNMYAFPGFEKLEDFDGEIHDLLMKLLLISIPSWGMMWKNWKSITIQKIDGRPHSFSPNSPLVFSLRETKWMQDKADEETIKFRPSDCWYIPPPALIGGRHQFSHLMLIPDSVASILSGNPELIVSMKDLGMPCYDPDEKTTDTRLLDDLAIALMKPSIEISNQSVFIGQVRAAWGQFCPDKQAVFPKNVVIQNGAGPLKAIIPSAEDVLYLPNATPAVHSGLERHSMPVIMMDTKDAKRLQDRFQKAYENGVYLASDLTIKALVEGSEWQKKDNGAQLSEEFPWLILVTLSVFAFHGNQSRGTSTKTFKNAMDALRKAKIAWVDNLAVGLWHGDNQVAVNPVTSFWLSEDSILLARRDTRNKVSQFSEELAAIVNRGDINVPLKLILKECEKEDEMTDDVTGDVVCAALKELHITTDHYQEVQQRWLGDLAWKIRLVRPLILLMKPDADVAPLDKISSEDEFEDAIQAHDLSPLKLDDILSKATSLKEVGYKAWETIPDIAKLYQWNEILSKLGEPSITNNLANDQFYDHVHSCQKIMRSVIRHTIRNNPDSGKFKDMEGELSNLECPIEYAETYWIVNFRDAMIKVCDVLVEWNTASNVVAATKGAKNAKDLRDQLDQLGLEPDIDPIEINADNRKLFFQTLGSIQEIAITWCIKENIGIDIWEKDDSFFEAKLSSSFNRDVFIEVWDEPVCLKLLGKLEYPQTHKKLKSAFNASSTVGELMGNLGISNADLTEAHEKLEERKRVRELRENTVKVCGVDFVNSENNLSGLWDHIHENIGDDSIVGVDLSDIQSLKKREHGKRQNKRDKRNSPNRTRTTRRVSQAIKDIVGLAGEIHVFRALKKSFGDEIVGPDNWISENSRHKYPENTIDDGFGCDFVVIKDGVTHYIEVKATITENESFELGSSEVELAIDSANRRNKKFVIYHVLNALDSTYRINAPLPNPYDKKHRDEYYFEEAGLRVRYKMP